MAIPKVTYQDILDALISIDDRGVPEKNRSRKYELVTKVGKRYPPKYVIAVADHLANGTDIDTNRYTSEESIKFLRGKDFAIDTKQPENKAAKKEELAMQSNGYKNPYSSMLIESNNIIFCGAPGTGKSYLAKEIAADIISNGDLNYKDLSDEQKKQVQFVQFHPSYDYSDFVEGLRPKVNDDGSMGFELQDGVFKQFVARARKNYYDSQKSEDAIKAEVSVQGKIADFLSSVKLGEEEFETMQHTKFLITGFDDKHIDISMPAFAGRQRLNIDDIRKTMESNKTFKKVKDVTDFFGTPYPTQAQSYYFAIHKEITSKAKKAKDSSKATAKQEEQKKYIFIIDEINRGEISKIFGELFFAIDPEYRGRSGEILTQYANLHTDPNEKFFIPENVYIIGTMNDIDRSVDSFDFAMRRRFRFVRLKAEERVSMLDSLENNEKKTDAIRRMKALNEEIASVDDLNENYHIGASYFLKLKLVLNSRRYNKPLKNSVIDSL